MDNYVKRRKTGITPAMKRTIWDIHIGIGYKTAKCPLCSLSELSNNVNSGFEAAHIVADKFFTDKLSVLYLYPSCKVCNNECEEALRFAFIHQKAC